jgi:hypothetical protein
MARMRLVVIALLVGCSSTKVDHEGAAAKIAAYTQQVCACQTPACAKQVNDELVEWSAELEKQLGDKAGDEAPLELQNRIVDDLNKFQRCFSRILALPK